MKRETLEQAHEADVARGVGFDPYTLRQARYCSVFWFSAFGLS